MIFKKYLSLLLSLVVLMSVFASCSENGNNAVSDVSITDESEISSETTVSEYTVMIGDACFDVDAINADDGDIRIYDRNYKKETYVLSFQLEKGSISIIAKPASDGNFTVSSVSRVSGNDVVIPVNGFVVIIPDDAVSDVKIGTTVCVSGYYPPEYENLDISTLKNGQISRRINMLFPKDGVLCEDKIYLCDDKNNYTVPANSSAMLLKKTAGTMYKITGFSESGSQVGETYSLLFCGEFNAEYCRHFFEVSDSITILNENRLNDITDLPAISIDDEIYIFDDLHYNSNSASDGISAFNNDYGRLVTPAFSDEYICAVVTDNQVVYISDISERIIIPSGDSYALVFTGSAFELAKNLNIGKKIKTMLPPTAAKPDSYVLIDGITYSFNDRNTDLEKRRTVLYSSVYGKSTGTPEETLEITIFGGKVTDVSTSGNAMIPSGGYVMSIDKNSSAYKNAVSIAKGAEAYLATEKYEYKTVVLDYTNINGVRYTDNLIIYDGKKGKYTGTNVYGYEIVVDENGIAIDGTTAGNSEIPENGFVVSGHGINSTALQELYQRGMYVIYDKMRKTVTFVKSPALIIVGAATQISDLQQLLDNAKTQYYAVNYSLIEEKLAAAQSLCDEALKEYEKGSIDSAIALSTDATDAVNNLNYYLYESSSVENRSTWYRSSEKSDEEVRATCEKMSALGINAIYIETWYNGNTIGYSSDDRIKHLSAVHGEYDVLEGFCRIAHEYDIEVHAWCENFFIGTPGGYLVELMKDKRCIDRNGKDRYPNGYGEFIFLNPNDRECRDLVLGVYKELVSNYYLDGIHLDYIRFSEPNSNDGDFGYNDDIIAGFQKEYNTDIDPHTIKSGDAMWTKWCKYRENIINSFVEEVYFSLKAINPDIYISAACYPDLYGVPQWNFQNFRDWVKKGYIDEIFSMSYGADLSYPLSNAKEFIKAINGKCFYSIGVCAFDQTAADILVQQIFYSLKEGACGSNTFSWGSLIGHKLNYFEALQCGVYSRKATMLNKGSVTVIAGIDDLIDNIDNVYCYLAPQYGDYYEKLKASANNILDIAKATDYESLDASQKLEYCQKALDSLNDIIKLADDVDDTYLVQAVKRCVDVTANAMRITITRLTVTPQINN